MEAGEQICAWRDQELGFRHVPSRIPGSYQSEDTKQAVGQKLGLKITFQISKLLHKYIFRNLELPECFKDF